MVQFLKRVSKGSWVECIMTGRPDPFEAFQTEENILIFFGLPVGNTWNGFYLFRGIISIAISISLMVSMIGRIVLELENIPLILEALYFGLTQTTFLCKICNIIICNYKVHRMKAYLKKPIFNVHTKKQDVFIQRAIDVCHLFAKTYRSFVGLTITFYAIFPFIENTLPLPGWFPMDTQKYWYPLYVYHLICLILNGYNHTSLDCMNASMISMASAQFEILKNNLVQLKQPDDDNLSVEQQDAIVQKRVKESVIHHDHIIEFISYIEDMYSNVIFIQFLCSILIMCVTGFQVFVMPPSRIQYVTLVLYFFCNLTQIAIYSWFGHDILTKSGGIGLACYMTEWNTVSPKSRKLIFMIMERSKIPIILTAGQFFHLSLNTLMMWLKLRNKQRRQEKKALVLFSSHIAFAGNDSINTKTYLLALSWLLFLGTFLMCTLSSLSFQHYSVDGLKITRNVNNFYWIMYGYVVLILRTSYSYLAVLQQMYKT